MCRAITGEKPPVAADRLMEDDFLWLSHRGLTGFDETFLAAVDWALRVRPEERPPKIKGWGSHLNSSADLSIHVESNASETMVGMRAIETKSRQYIPPKKRKTSSIIVAGFIAIALIGCLFAVNFMSQARESARKEAVEEATRLSEQARIARAAEAARQEAEQKVEAGRQEAERKAEAARQDSIRKLATERAAQEKRKKDDEAKQAAELQKSRRELAERVSLKGIYVPNFDAEGSDAQDRSVMNDTRFEKIKEHEKNQDYFEIMPIAKSLVNDFPQSALAQRSLSDAYYYAGLLDDALSAAKKAIDLDPENGRGWNNLAILSGKSGQESRSNKILAHAVKLAPNDVKLLIEYARSIYESDSSAAFNALQQANKLLAAKEGVDPETAGYHLGAGLVSAYAEIGNTADAYNAAKTLAPIESDPLLWLRAGETAGELQQYSEVLPALEKAVALDSSLMVRAKCIYGNSQVQQGNVTDAIIVFEEARAIAPNDIGVLQGLIFATASKPTLISSDYKYMSKCMEQVKAVDRKWGEELEASVIKYLKNRN